MLLRMTQDPAARAETATPDDEQVVARVRAGDIAAFELVMRRYNQRIYRVVRAIVRDEDETVDVMQSAYLNAIAHIQGFSGKARFATWLTRIAVHEALGRLRQRKRTQPLNELDEDSGMASPGPGPEDQVGSRELRGLLERAVDSLPEAFRTTFVLRSIENLSVAETAEVLGIPEETVKTRHHRARERLQASLLERAGSELPSLFGFHRERCDRVVFVVLERMRTRPIALERLP
jgi:RNA polymerase sigma-70 factor (ECF subfamily)